MYVFHDSLYIEDKKCAVSKLLFKKWFFKRKYLRRLNIPIFLNTDFIVYDAKNVRSFIVMP